jgi:hypothetical protein
MDAKKKIKLYMGIPSTGDRADVHTYLFRELQERYADKIEFIWPENCVHRIFHDFARNAIVEDFLASGADILWFLDSDVCPPKFVLDIVTVHGDKWEAAGSPYPIWMTPPGGSEPGVLLTCYKGVIDDGVTKGIGMADVPQSGTDFVDALATGCLFLKRSLLERMEAPYFEFKFDPKTRQLTEGEDLGFALKLAKMGVKFFVDYSTVCKHYKKVCLLDVNNFAISLSNKKVLEYDKEIRSQVEAAVQQAMDQAYKLGVQDGAKGQKGRSFQIKADSGLILPQGY